MKRPFWTPSKKQRRKRKEVYLDDVPSEIVGALKLVSEPPRDQNYDMNIVAIHGLETTSNRTWVYKKDGSRMEWLKDSNMLPKVVPSARIYTYDWEANFYKESTTQTLHEQAISLLSHLKDKLGSEPKPILFIASCFGGLVLAKALRQADTQTGSYQKILLSTIGIVFLATPFKGTTVANVARLQVSIGRFLGEWSSRSLITRLDGSDELLKELRIDFGKTIEDSRVNMPIAYFYETRETELLRRLFPPCLANAVSPFFFRITRRILVEQSSACLVADHNGISLSLTHSNMNKFSGPGDANYDKVRMKIKELVDKRWQTLDNRKESSRKAFRLLPNRTISEFIGRKKELEDILGRADHVDTPQAHRLTVITGLEGIGKTELALEAAYRIAEKHADWAIFWISGNSYANFKEGYCQIAECLEVDAGSEDVIRLVNEKLRKRPARWLLVIDEVDNTTKGGPEGKGWELTKEMLPQGQQGFILITTGSRRIAGQIFTEPIRLLSMDEDDAIQLLRLPLQNDSLSGLLDSPNDQREFVKFLTYLPLAIKLASNYMATTETSVRSYLKLCHEGDKRMIRTLFQGYSDHNREGQASRLAVSTTWLISLNRIRDEYPNCVKCLEQMAFYHSKNIPIGILLNESAETVDVWEVIDVLVGYSFVSKHRDQNCVDIHQLVQLAMKEWLTKRQGPSTGATSAINNLLASLPFPTQQTEKKWRESIRHAEEALKYKDESVYDYSTWRLLYMVGQANFLFREDKKAKEYHERARKMESLQIANKENPALVSRYQGKYEQAEKEYRKEIKGGSQIKDQITTLTIKKNLACTFLIQGKHEAARDEYQQAYDTEKELLGKDHPSTLSTMDSLAFVLKSQGKREDAKELYRKVLEAKKKRLGKDNLSTVTSMYNLAMMYQHEGDIIQAEELHQEALQWRISLLGKDHPSLLSSYENLALVFERQGNYKDAVKMLEKTVELKNKTLGARHPSTARSEDDLTLVRASNSF
ncbi:hypothetical protein ASPBRDRAFT_205284 [Aspergillus brasiliensis CBS 101740]|uniref:AAA+ ATPase domain-containing protein n=1 Tax=Aspergillus brasiliensis (strain CBS 101740 / IMI 381727 / IBT 21946) TaxID=767769 RepID=A0A1L9UU83_ASPBC|nr:hypothetical protein ASPBRDRAFT_205284 [Aspergillus brasiliensis CBS 101740]